MSNKNPVATAIEERLKSHIFGSLVISFFSWHWRVFFYLFTGTHSADERIRFVETYYSKYSILEFYLSPLLLSLTYLFILPILNDWYEHFPRKFKQRKDVLDKESEMIAESMAQYKRSIYSLAEAMRQNLQNTNQFLSGLETQLATVQPHKFFAQAEPNIRQFKARFDNDFSAIKTLSFAQFGTLDRLTALSTLTKNRKFLLEKLNSQNKAKES